MLASLLVPSILIGIYGWLSAVSFGLSLLRLLPRATLVKQALRLSLPVWGLANVFLAAALVAGTRFFGTGTTTVFQLMQPYLYVGLAGLLAQSLLIISLVYSNAKVGFRPANLAYAFVSYLTPVIMSVAGIRLLHGGWIMFVAVLVGLLTLAMSFTFYVVGHTPHDRLHQLSRWLIIGLAVVLIAALSPLVTIVAASLVVVQVVLGLFKQERYSWWFLSLVAIGGPWLLAEIVRASLLALR